MPVMPTIQHLGPRPHQARTLAQSFEHGFERGTHVPPQTTALYLLPCIGLFIAFVGWLLFRALRFFIRVTR